MEKTAQLLQVSTIGASAAFDSLIKHAETGEIDYEQIEKAATARAQIVINEVEKNAAIDSMVDTLQGSIDWLKEAGFDKASDALYKQAQEEMVEAGVSDADMSDEAPSDEESEAAAIDGAAQVIATATGKEKEDPDVQEAAVEAVQQAVAEAAPAE